jgi:hypothetical protein
MTTPSTSTPSVSVSVPVFRTDQSFIAFEEDFQIYLAAKDLKEVFQSSTDPRLAPNHPRYPGVLLSAIPLVHPEEPDVTVINPADRERIKFELILYDRQMTAITKERAFRDKWRLSQANGCLALQEALKEQPEALLLVKGEVDPYVAFTRLQNVYRGAVGGVVVDKGMIQTAKDAYHSSIFTETAPPSVQIAGLRQLQQQLQGTTSAITEDAFLDDVIAKFSKLSSYATTVELYQNTPDLSVNMLLVHLTTKFNRLNAASVTPAAGFWGGGAHNNHRDGDGDRDREKLPSFDTDNNVFRKEKCSECHQFGHNKMACRIWRAAHPRDKRPKKKDDDNIGMFCMAATPPLVCLPSRHMGSVGNWLFGLFLFFLWLCSGTADFSSVQMMT